MCEAWNEAGEATQSVRVTIKGKINLDKNKERKDFFFKQKNVAKLSV